MDKCKNSSDMEDKIFDIVTDLLREDISKTEAIDKLLILHSVSKSFYCNHSRWWKLKNTIIGTICFKCRYK